MKARRSRLKATDESEDFEKKKKEAPKRPKNRAHYNPQILFFSHPQFPCAVKFVIKQRTRGGAETKPATGVAAGCG